MVTFATVVVDAALPARGTDGEGGAEDTPPPMPEAAPSGSRGKSRMSSTMFLEITDPAGLQVLDPNAHTIAASRALTVKAFADGGGSGWLRRGSLACRRRSAAIRTVCARSVSLCLDVGVIWYSPTVMSAVRLALHGGLLS